MRIAQLSFNFHKFPVFLRICKVTFLKKYLSVADNARDAVLLHVPASSERQE